MNRVPESVRSDNAGRGRALLVANYNAVRRPYNGVVFEFLQTIAAVENATIVAPEARRYAEALFADVAREYASVHNEMLSVLCQKIGLPSVARTRRSTPSGEFDICFYMCQFPRDLAEIERVSGWRERSAKACAFILETWPHTMPKFKADLRILDRFDHVFVLNSRSIEALRQYTSTPISFLPTGTDCLVCGPDLGQPPERCIDFLSLGRREKSTHRLLCDYADRNGRFYYYDAWASMTARDWSQARRMSAELIRRAKYYVAWDPASIIALKGKGHTPQTVLSTRFFEGAAGGAVLVGSRPAVADFDALFDWPDAVIDLPNEADALISALGELDADPARRAAISLTNRVQSMRRHDWVYRWAAVLETMGLARTAALDARIALLERMAADAVSNAAGPPATAGRKRRAGGARPNGIAVVPPRRPRSPWWRVRDVPASRPAAGRGDWIRTSDLRYPKPPRYQAAPRPDGPASSAWQPRAKGPCDSASEAAADAGVCA